VRVPPGLPLRFDLGRLVTGHRWGPGAVHGLGTNQKQHDLD
jgi:hypothetical protein